MWLDHTCAAKGWKAQENRLIQILNPQAKSAFQQSSRHHVWWSSPWQIYTHIINRKYPNLTCSNILFCKRISREESWWDPLYLDTPIKKMDTSVFLPKRRVSGECVWAHCFLLEFVYKFKSLGDQKKYISYVLSKGKSDSQNSIGLMIESCINLEDFVQGYKLIVSLQLRWRQAKINQALFFLSNKSIKRWVSPITISQCSKPVMTVVH